MMCMLTGIVSLEVMFPYLSKAASFHAESPSQKFFGASSSWPPFSGAEEVEAE